MVELSPTNQIYGGESTQNGAIQSGNVNICDVHRCPVSSRYAGNFYAIDDGQFQVGCDLPINATLGRSRIDESMKTLAARVFGVDADFNGNGRSIQGQF